MTKGAGVALSCLLLTANTAYAGEQPVYDAGDETLTIPSVTVGGQPGFIQDVILSPAGDGLWRVGQLHEGVLLEEQVVNDIWTTSTTGLPHQFFIHVAGTFPNGCPEVGRIEQLRQGNDFQVNVYYKNNEWLRNPEVVLCTAALQPFEFTIPLDIYGLKAGEYSVRINDHALRTFVLEQDNVGPDQFAGERRPHCQYDPKPQSGSVAYGCSDDPDLTLQ